MRLLIADPDRDFLASYRKISEARGHEVTAVFDGVTAVVKIGAESYDAVFVNEAIPRVAYREIVSLAKEKNEKTVILTDNIRTILKSKKENGSEPILAFPFTPDEFFESVGGEEKNE